MKAFVALCLLLFGFCLDAQDTSFTRDTNVAVPMRDGVILRADVWRPAADGKYPVLLYRTPYGKHAATAAHSRDERLRRRLAGCSRPLRVRW